MDVAVNIETAAGRTPSPLAGGGGASVSVSVTFTNIERIAGQPSYSGHLPINGIDAVFKGAKQLVTEAVRNA